MARVIVTGGAGFIGSHLVDRLVLDGHSIIVVDDLSSGSKDNLPKWDDPERLELVVWDVSNPLTDCERLSGLSDISCIFHLAARIDVLTSFDDPLDDARRNYIGTLNTLEFARRVECPRIIFSSSAAIFDDGGEVPIDEQFPKRPQSVYGLHKLMSESILDLYQERYKMTCASFRFFNVYGPRQDPSNPYSGVISRFISLCQRGGPLTVFGDGEQTRDFVFVGDVVECLMKGFEREGAGCYNVGTGKETSVNRLAEMIISLTGKECPVEHLPEKKGEIKRSLSDISRAEEELGYRPATSLKEGIDRTVKWYLEKIRSER